MIISLRPDIYETIFIERDDGSNLTVVNGFIDPCSSPVPVLIDVWLLHGWQCCLGDTATLFITLVHYGKQGNNWMVRDVTEEQLALSDGRWVTTTSTGCYLGPDDQSYTEYLDEIIFGKDNVGLEVLSVDAINCGGEPDTIWIRSNLSPTWEVASAWLNILDYGVGVFGAPLTNSLDADGIRYPFDLNNGEPQWTFLSISEVQTSPLFFMQGGAPATFVLRDESKMFVCDLRLTRTWDGTRSFVGVLTGTRTGQPLTEETILGYVVDACDNSNLLWVECKLGTYANPEITYGEVRRIESSGVDCGNGFTFEKLRPITEVVPDTYKVYVKITATVPLIDFRLIGKLKLLTRTITFFDEVVNVDATIVIFDGPVYDLDIPVNSWWLVGAFSAILEEISASIIDGVLSMAGPAGTALAQVIDVQVRIE